MDELSRQSKAEKIIGATTAVCIALGIFVIGRAIFNLWGLDYLRIYSGAVLITFGIRARLL